MLSHFSHAQMALIYAKEEHIFFLSEQQDARGCCFTPVIWLWKMKQERQERAAASVELPQHCSVCVTAMDLLLSFTETCRWNIRAVTWLWQCRSWVSGNLTVQPHRRLGAPAPQPKAHWPKDAGCSWWHCTRLVRCSPAWLCIPGPAPLWRVSLNHCLLGDERRLPFSFRRP